MCFRRSCARADPSVPFLVSEPPSLPLEATKSTTEVDEFGCSSGHSIVSDRSLTMELDWRGRRA